MNKHKHYATTRRPKNLNMVEETSLVILASFLIFVFSAAVFPVALEDFFEPRLAFYAIFPTLFLMFIWCYSGKRSHNLTFNKVSQGPYLVYFGVFAFYFSMLGICETNVNAAQGVGIIKKLNLVDQKILDQYSPGGKIGRTRFYKTYILVIDSWRTHEKTADMFVSSSEYYAANIGTTTYEATIMPGALGVAWVKKIELARPKNNPDDNKLSEEAIVQWKEKLHNIEPGHFLNQNNRP